MDGKFQLVDRGWWAEIEQAASKCRGELRIVCPFITKAAVEHILRAQPELRFKVITRFRLEDWATGVSSPKALRLLLAKQATIRGIKDLHAKLFVFDRNVAILGSTNLTHAALRRNHELGVVITHQQSVQRCSRYFDDLWRDAGSTLTPELLARYERELGEICRKGGPQKPGPLYPDYGAAVSRVSAAPPFVERAGADGSFIKFFGTTTNRFFETDTIESELVRSGCHWACGYSKRPRNVNHGSVVFLARLMKNDTTIFGRAIAFPYHDGVDDATPEDIAKRQWKDTWPYHVRVLHPEFVAGTFSNGVSLFQLMDDLGADSFLTTQVHAKSGRGNTDPRAALRRQPSVSLSKQAYSLLTERLEQTFAVHGKLDLAKLPNLDWPEHMNRLNAFGRQLLDTLRRQLAADIIDLEDPRTFPRYKDIPPWFDLEPSPGQNIIRQVRVHCGLDSLDDWTRRYGLPAISGLVVTEKSGQLAPGDLFFRLHRKQRSRDMDWWRDQLRRAASYDWGRLLE